MADFLSDYRTFLKEGVDLPTLPTVVAELNVALGQERTSTGRIAAIINRDPAIATKMLRLANSAAFNCGTPVAHVQQAIQLLGIRQVRSLCVALSVVNVFSRTDGPIKESFWHHSTAVAIMARELARCLGYQAISMDELYMGGLLHDVGLLVMNHFYPDKLEESIKLSEGCGTPLWTAEQIVLGTEHGELGGLILDRWALPPSIVAMVSSHHNPKLGPERYRDACWLIYTAEQICGGLGPSIAPERLTAERAVKVLDTMRSADFDIDEVVNNVRVTSDEFSTLSV